MSGVLGLANLFRVVATFFQVLTRVWCSCDVIVCVAVDCSIVNTMKIHNIHPAHCACHTRLNGQCQRQSQRTRAVLV
jgi:hypothetical protein